MNVMQKLKVDKVTVNMGVGEGGERLAKAENLLEQLTGQKPKRTFAKSTNPTFEIRKGLPIGCKVTLRKELAEKFLEKTLIAVDHKIKKSSFDPYGNVTIGIKEHTDLPGVKYDPAVGMLGMDVSLTIERPGFRVKRRKLRPAKISKTHLIGSEDALKFLVEKYKVNLEE